MNKLKSILGSFSLVVLLSYLCFIDKVDSMKKDFLLKAYTLYEEHNLSRVNVNIKGDDFKMKRVLVLTGTVLNMKLKEEATSLAFSIDGVREVENNLHITETEELRVKKRKNKSYFI